jgi:hypothetical protein
MSFRKLAGDPAGVVAPKSTNTLQLVETFIDGRIELFDGELRRRNDALATSAHAYRYWLRCSWPAK